MEKAMDSLARFEPVGLAALSLRPCRESALAVDKRENLTFAGANIVFWAEFFVRFE
jgi:hypothetical protein